MSNLGNSFFRGCLKLYRWFDPDDSISETKERQSDSVAALEISAEVRQLLRIWDARYEKKALKRQVVARKAGGGGTS